VQNGTLREYLDISKSLQAAEQIDIIHQMIFGLAYLHNHKISHEDFKSLNVLLDAGQGYSSSDCILSELFCLTCWLTLYLAGLARTSVRSLILVCQNLRLFLQPWAQPLSGV
jgi:serine/threonine protein kinase